MRRAQRPHSLLRNLGAGTYNPVQRVALIVVNTFRKIPGGGCCGNYGEPGC